MRSGLLGLVVVASLLAIPRPAARACTNFLVSKGASRDGSTMITYAADSHELYGDLYYKAGSVHPPGSWREIHDWEANFKYLGRIPEVERTFTVVGLMNEHQVAIGETTFGGLKELTNEKATVDYLSLMTIALERAKTAREAVQIMGAIAEKYGFASPGESFSVADPKEVWLLEMVGSGKGNKVGALWVARRIPDGYVSGHANQSRIRTFPLKDKDTLVGSDTIAFARRKGWFKGADKDFSFADTYSPMTGGIVRACDSRVWSMFRRINKDANKYIDYIKGKPGAERLPLWIKPERKLAVQDVMELMRDHFEGTELDLTDDFGAGPFKLPYRWRPMYWYTDEACDACEKKKGKEKPSCLKAKKCVKYLNERATSTQQTGYSFVTQSRGSLPGPIGGVLWFGVDDTASTVYLPMYAGLLKVPHHVAQGTGDFKTFTWDSAFWVFNMVANFAYSRYSDMIKDIRKAQRELEGSFLARQPEIEKHAVGLYKQSPERAREYLTQYSDELTKRTVARWRALLPELLLKYMDGNVRDSTGKVTHPEYPKEHYRRLIRETGNRYRVPVLPNEPPEDKLH
jgi:dipeptidase